MEAPETTIGASLIVRDEETAIGPCLDALGPFVDEIVVADTGSRDRTAFEVVQRGATLVDVEWAESFSLARNAALEQATTSWVISVDADEIISGDARTLRTFAAGVDPSIDAISVQIRRAEGADARGLDTHRELKLFRRTGVEWHGRVHERLHLIGGGEPRFVVVDPELVELTHFGYGDEATILAKSRRNARLCTLELDELVAASAPIDRIARAALDLGRSYLGAGDGEAASVAFDLVRRVVHGGPAWRWATDFLAHLALSSGRADDALDYVEELVGDDAPLGYCNWLRALAFAERGDREGARAALLSIERFVDLSGRTLATDRLDELAELLRER